MFKRLLSALTGQKPASPAPAPAPAPTPTPATITVHDAYGRELTIARQEWREKVFGPNLRLQWDAPDALYQLVISGLNDGFNADVLPAAERLLAIDPIAERSHTLLGIVQMKNGQLDAAEATLQAGMARAGRTGTLLTNLAKVTSLRGDQVGAQDILWQALQADPNQDNGLLWWAAIERERGGDAGHLQAMQRVAALPGSWRAQLWLARHHLQTQDLAAAQALYAQVLEGGQYDGSALMMISGDLGSHGHLPQMLALVGPLYDEHRHDPMAGLNLLRACQQLGRLDEGEALLARLYALGMAPIRQQLDSFAQAFQQLRQQATPATPVDPAQLSIGTVVLNQPVWQYGLRQADWLLSQKPADAPQVGFFALSTITGDRAQGAESQLEDDIGRLTRSVPLYLAEAVHGWSDFAASTYIVIVEGGGPVVTSAATDGHALFDVVPPTMQQLVTGEIGCTGHGDSARWELRLSLWHRDSPEPQWCEQGQTDAAGLGALVLALEQRLLARLGAARGAAFDAFYTRPTAEMMPVYLNGLAQSLMLSLLANGQVPSSAMWGERAMLDWPLKMTLQWPAQAVHPLMYLSGLGKARDYHSTVLPEYKERSLQLLREARERGSPAARLAPLVWQIFGMTEELRAHRHNGAEPSPAYQAWLERLSD